MRVVFADTVSLLAIWDDRDQWHQQASVVYAELLAANARILTTTYVLLECGNAAARRPYRDALIQLRQKLRRNGLLLSPLKPIVRSLGMPSNAKVRQAQGSSITFPSESCGG